MFYLVKLQLMRAGAFEMLNVLDLCLSCFKWKMFTLNFLDMCSLGVQTVVPDHM